MGSLTLTTTLARRGPAAAIILQDDQVEQVGEGAKRFPVAATINGHTWRTTVVRMRGEFLLGLNKEVRHAAGFEAGDTVEAEIALDTAPREVELPEDLAAALKAEPAAQTAYDSLSYTHRKEYARWVSEAKRPETRDRRIAETIQRLNDGTAAQS